VERDPELFKKDFPNITLIKNIENFGFAKGNNTGIKIAKGNTILLLNSDTVLIENSIFNCYQKLEQLGSDVGIITCKLIYPDGTIQRQCSRFPAVSTNLLELLRLHKLLPAKKQADLFLSSYFDHETDTQPDWCWGTFFMFRKDLLEMLPEQKLNEDFFMYCEDMKWCYDFRKMGKKVYYFAGTKVVHLVGKSTKNIKTKIDNIVKNELRFVGQSKGMLYKTLYRLIRILNISLAPTYENKRMDIEAYMS
jgi:GT2 family glycosyltransferase